MNIAVLISGTGRTLRNLFDLENQIGGKINLVIGTPNAPGLKHCPASVKVSTDPDVFGVCSENKVDLVCLAGWLRKIHIPDEWYGRVMNIHPSLLPAFGGKGMYGDKIHKAVLDSGVKVSGCTIHFVNNEYDKGPIIDQRVVPVLDDDTTESLAARVFEQEKIAYPQVIKWYADNRLKISGNRVLLSNEIISQYPQSNF